MDAALLPAVAPRIAERIYVDADTGCWLWQGYRDRDGYGVIHADNRAHRAHRYVYAQLVGPIPPYLVLDHVKARGCCNRHCVNPAHLEPVSVRINSQRVKPWNRAKTHCRRGHDYATHGTTYVGKDGYRRRYCVACDRGRGDTNRRVAA